MAGNADTRQQAADAAAVQSQITKAENVIKLNKLRSSIANWQKLIKDNNQLIADSQSAIATYSKEIKDGKFSNGETMSPQDIIDTNNLITAYQKTIATNKADNKKLNGYIQSSQTTIQSILGPTAADRAAATAYSTKKVKTAPNGAGNAGGSGGSGPQPPTYLYNAPMVSSAYFNPLGPQAKMLGDEITIDKGSYTDALQAWRGQGGRGTIQMDRTINPTVAINAIRAAGVKSQYLDKNLYGFKFLYNPTTVSMGWGVSAEVNPAYENLGMDAASPMALGLIQSNISFELFLNRIEDFKYIDENGLKNVQTGTQTRNRFAGETIGIVAEPVPLYGKIPNPYPYKVDDSELQLIYNKGTMYDLEYLFRVVMGFNANYKSTLNGVTADRGWISNIAVELHLGAGLRYRVRISSLDVTHIVFNERMVPILSKVTMQCTRYYDSPLSSTDKTSIQASNGGTAISTSTNG